MRRGGGWTVGAASRHASATPHRRMQLPPARCPDQLTDGPADGDASLIVRRCSPESCSRRGRIPQGHRVTFERWRQRWRRRRGAPVSGARGPFAGAVGRGSSMHGGWAGRRCCREHRARRSRPCGRPEPWGQQCRASPGFRRGQEMLIDARRGAGRLFSECLQQVAPGGRSDLVRCRCVNSILKSALQEAGGASGAGLAARPSWQ